jgi:hypothetical protein
MGSYRTAQIVEWSSVPREGFELDQVDPNERVSEEVRNAVSETPLYKRVVFSGKSDKADEFEGELKVKGIEVQSVLDFESADGRRKLLDSLQEKDKSAS